MTDVMEIDSFIVSDIRIGKDRRPVDPKRLKALIKSIEDMGLKTPITVWTADNGGSHGAVHLVAGLHRLEAYKKLDRKLIEAFRTSGGELDRDLWQIDENLMRSDLTAGERAEHISRRGKIIKARKKLSAKLADDSKGGPKDTGQVEFVAETAAMSGRSFRAVERDKRRGDNIAPEVMEAIKDMPAADIGVELDALAGLSHWDQSIAVECVKRGEVKNFREAKAGLNAGREASKADKAKVRAARKKMRKFQAEYVEEREARAGKRTVNAEEETEYTDQDRKQFENMKLAFFSSTENARELFTEWVKARPASDSAGGTP